MADTVDIALLVYPGAQTAAVHGLVDLFAVASRLAQGRTTLRVSQWQPGDATVMTPAVVVIPPSLGTLPDADTLTACRPWLQAQHARGAVLGAVCIGAFVLAETGLLDGRRATTHASQVAQFAAQFPKVRVQVDVPIIDDGELITSAGLMAWTDLGLRVVARLLGSEVARQTARFLAVEVPLQGEDHFSPRLAHGDAQVLKVQHWLHGNGAHNVSAAAMAEQAGLEPRTLLRRFRAATGLTPTQYCQQVRVSTARELLEWTRDTVDHIAWRVGYQDPATFRITFRRITGLAPGEYRTRSHRGRG
ncbi:GlxA family transcriptional regulator [Pseudomonas putida]